MAVLLYLRFGLVLILIGLFSSSKNYITTVNAAAYKKLEGGSPLKILNSPPPKILLRKHSTILPCTPSLTDNIFVTWYRNGEKLRNAHIYGNGSLKIPQNEKSSGTYRCLINDTNLEYGALYSTETIVEYPVLKRIPAPANQTVLNGDSFLINCPIESVPTANISWFFENNIIPYKLNETRFVQLRNGSLLINNISQSCQGKFKCVAANDYSVKTNRQFIIHIFVHQSSVSTNILQNLHDTNDVENLVPALQNAINYIEIGKNFTLYCTGYNNDVKIEWWFAAFHSQEFLKVRNNSKELQIQNANIEHDQGIYKCSTSSSSQSFRVIVTTPPIIETPISSFESSIAATIMFNCNVSSGNPLPNITWYRNGVKLENSYTIHINRSILRIESLDLQDAGIYQCFAKNIAGESVSTAFVALRQMHNIESLPEHPSLVKCFAVNYTTLNVTFDSRQAGMFRMMNVYVASEKNPWTANIHQNLGSKNYFLIRDDDSVPIFDPFKLYLRSIIVTATRKVNGGQPENSVETSILSEGIDCATQGLDIHSIIYEKGIFIWWSNFKFIDVKGFIIQFLTNETDKNTFRFTSEINGTTITINSTLSPNEIEEKFIKIPLLKNFNHIFKADNSANYPNDLLIDNDDGEVFGIAVTGNVTGLFIPNTAKITVRIISLTEKNKNLRQDLRYLQWRTFKDWTEIKVKTIESRRVNFLWNSVDEISCIYVCYIKTYPSDHSTTECKNISMNSVQFSVTGLKPRTAYEMTFSECNSSKYYAHVEVYTEDDPPGPISNYTILKSKGVKLIWNPPINPNGKILNYFIYWTVKNQTHVTKLPGTETSFRFPNITEDEKFNITVRAAGDFGIGLPIYIDLKKLSKPLVNENENNILIDHTLGIAIGTSLSIMCVVIFMFIFVRQRRKFKYHISSPYRIAAAGSASGPGINQSDGQTQRNSPTTDQYNFQPIINASTDEQLRQQNEIERSIEFHEMQTLIPKQPNQYHIITITDNNCTPTTVNKLQNGNSIMKCQTENIHDDDFIEDVDGIINCPIALCSSTPLPAKRKIDSNENQPVNELVVTKQQNLKDIYDYNNKLTKISSSPNFSIHNSTLNANGNGSAASAATITPEIIGISPKFKNPSKKNDSVKLFLPPKKHSISSATSEPKLMNGHDSTKKPTTDSNSNTSPVDNNSQIKLIENNSSTCDKNYSQNSTNNYNNDSNCTTSTLLHFIDDSNSRTNSIGNHLTKNNWTHNRRPIVDPNG